MLAHRLQRYPDRHDQRARGTAETFEQARVEFEAAWRDYLPRCTEADFAEHRRHRAATARKYRMHDTGAPLPTQRASGRSKCSCGEPLTIASVDGHIRQTHMDMA